MIAWRRPKKRRQRLSTPKLRFSPYAWAKLLFLRDAGSTEVGGFGISSIEDPLLVEDFILIDQTCTSVSVQFDDLAVADYFEDQVDQGRTPDQFARIWIHTHPGDCPEPSGMDEQTFQRCFGNCDWSLMFILARGGATYAILKMTTGPRLVNRLSVDIDYRCEFPAASHDDWLGEYDAKVRFDDPFRKDAPLDNDWSAWQIPDDFGTSWRCL